MRQVGVTDLDVIVAECDWSDAKQSWKNQRRQEAKKHCKSGCFALDYREQSSSNDYRDEVAQDTQRKKENR